MSPYLVSISWRQAQHYVISMSHEGADRSGFTEVTPQVMDSGNCSHGSLGFPVGLMSTIPEGRVHVFCPSFPFLLSPLLLLHQVCVFCSL
jgi:hypothetical protein